MAQKVNAVGRIGIIGYEINQDMNDGQMTLHLTVVNPNGEIRIYTDILNEFEEFIKSKNTKNYDNPNLLLT